ncbi:uncharacterized protein LOC131302837 [Rhododendron vialii]|uniref:uncharacterized protein LOC131302837 n=1 Tax=Rhododendron vialii TaxID=182163 RepID=UPI00265E03BF|nr:uncharacterized protein LOC131302837 [Rhododendron vialii]
MLCRDRVITWHLPLAGEIKLNTDGSFYNPKKSGFGGVFRDSSGSWILGFYGKAESSSSLEAEIWALYRGLQIILDKGMSNVKIESDSSVAVQYLQQGTPPDNATSGAGVVGEQIKARVAMWIKAKFNIKVYTVEDFKEARRVAAGTNSSFSHIFRQANQTVDCLAHLGSQQEDDLIVTRNVPFAAREFVMADALGVGHLRV